jgi:hypothetical protein
MLDPEMVDVGRLLGIHTAKQHGPSVPAVMEHAVVPGEAPPLERGVDFATGRIAVLFVVLAAITSIPILLDSWPPLADYINHLARMHVIATVDSDPDLARFYQIDWQVIPNLMMDLVVPTLSRIVNIYLAGQFYTIMSFVLILSGTFALNRQLYGHWSMLPLIAFPLLYNTVFLVGTMNYVFGIGLSLWALAAWAALRERAMTLRLAVSTLIVFLLFFCHLFSVGVYAIGVLAFELQRLLVLRAGKPLSYLSRSRADRRPSAFVDFVAGGVPFLLVLPLLLLSPTWGLRGTIAWQLAGKLDGLLFAIEVYSRFATCFLSAIVAIAIVWGIWWRVLQFHLFGWLLLAVGGVIYLALPRVMFDTQMADQRLPISLAFMIVACAHLNLRHDVVRRAFASVLVVLVAVRVFEVQSVWGELSPITTSFRQSVRHIDRGAKVLVAYADQGNGDDVRGLGLMHAACLAIIERSALVSTAFTVVGKQIMHVRGDYRARVDTEDGTPPSMKQLLQAVEQTDGVQLGYWARWTADFDYLYVLFTESDYENPDPARLIPIYTGNRFVLYQISGP